jgi:2-(1,2-epoxy-1,2-dihydrophenyl)acetyl-CoA isomerase
MEYRYLLAQRDRQICRLIMNRPERLNALNFRIGVELLDALDECDHDAEVRAVVLTGAGRAFCAGDGLARDVRARRARAAIRRPDKAIR